MKVKFENFKTKKLRLSRKLRLSLSSCSTNVLPVGNRWGVQLYTPQGILDLILNLALIRLNLVLNWALVRLNFVLNIDSNLTLATPSLKLRLKHSHNLSRISSQNEPRAGSMGLPKASRNVVEWRTLPLRPVGARRAIPEWQASMNDHSIEPRH